MPERDFTLLYKSTDTPRRRKKKKETAKIKYGLTLSEEEKPSKIAEIMEEYRRTAGYKVRWLFRRVERNGVQRNLPGITNKEVVDIMQKSKHLLKKVGIDNNIFGVKKLNGTNFALVFEQLKDNAELINVYFAYIPEQIFFGVKTYLWKEEGRYYNINTIWLDEFYTDDD